MSPRTAPITLAELWQLALPAGTRLVAGEAGLDQGVTWVASLGSTVPLFGTIEPGYLAFADLGVAQRIDPRITFAYLARGLVRAGVVGLVLTKAPEAPDKQVADELPLPILVLPDGADLAASERDVLRALIDHEGQMA
ncbi:MAG: PucR family transcriptional regulator ligand-binding domain-containing protein, partial [Anaerolineae bacterium]